MLVPIDSLLASLLLTGKLSYAIDLEALGKPNISLPEKVAQGSVELPSTVIRALWDSTGGRGVKASDNLELFTDTTGVSKDTTVGNGVYKDRTGLSEVTTPTKEVKRWSPNQLHLGVLLLAVRADRFPHPITKVLVDNGLSSAQQHEAIRYACILGMRRKLHSKPMIGRWYAKGLK